VVPSSRARPAMLALAAALAAAWLCVCVVQSAALARIPTARDAKTHFACSGTNSAKVPCHFSTPGGNIRCLWTPKPNNVACELVAAGRGYRLGPTGKAKSIHLTLKGKGETLPTNQQIVFPESLSCHDTKTTMTCNQDFLTGFFRLAPKGSRSA
jgi:hypothetical protein